MVGLTWPRFRFLVFQMPLPVPTFIAFTYRRWRWGQGFIRHVHVAIPEFFFIRAIFASDEEEEDSGGGGQPDKAELQNQLRTLNAKLEDLTTCNDLITKHGAALHVSRCCTQRWFHDCDLVRYAVEKRKLQTAAKWCLLSEVAGRVWTDGSARSSSQNQGRYWTGHAVPDHIQRHDKREFSVCSQEMTFGVVASNRRQNTRRLCLFLYIYLRCDAVPRRLGDAICGELIHYGRVETSRKLQAAETWEVHQKYLLLREQKFLFGGCVAQLRVIRCALAKKNVKWQERKGQNGWV